MDCSLRGAGFHPEMPGMYGSLRCPVDRAGPVPFHGSDAALGNDPAVCRFIALLVSQTSHSQ